MESLIDDARAIFEAAVRGVQADRLLGDLDLRDYLDRDLSSYKRVLVVGTGKASMAMAGAVEEVVGDHLDDGLVVVPHGYPSTLPATQRAPQRIGVAEGGHPVPDADGAEAARRVLDLAASCGEDDLLLALISGGGSALWPAFAEGIGLDAVQETFRLLLRSGVDIHQVNTVRKHLSRISGGRLATAAAPATVLAFVVSDVPGDDLSVIASGPTVPDPTTFEDAVGVLHDCALWDRVPSGVCDHLERGVRGDVPESPKPGAKPFERVTTTLIGTNRQALAAARERAEHLGYEAHIEGHRQEGEAREVGAELARTALGLYAERPVCLLWGGETTVTVTGSGMGGRNQEVALGAATVLDGAPRPVVFLSGGTDGIDGPTDAAGAWATPSTLAEARRFGLDSDAVLANNDAYPFFEKLDALLTPGPTHTNVMDVQVVLVGPMIEDG